MFPNADLYKTDVLFVKDLFMCATHLQRRGLREMRFPPSANPRLLQSWGSNVQTRSFVHSYDHQYVCVGRRLKS